MENELQNQNNDENKSIGSLIAIIIILSVFIAGALYFWGEFRNKQNVTPPVLTEEIVVDDASVENSSLSDIPATEAEENI